MNDLTPEQIEALDEFYSTIPQPQFTEAELDEMERYELATRYKKGAHEL